MAPQEGVRDLPDLFVVGVLLEHLERIRPLILLQPDPLVLLESVVDAVSVAIGTAGNPGTGPRQRLIRRLPLVHHDPTEITRRLAGPTGGIARQPNRAIRKHREARIEVDGWGSRATHQRGGGREVHRLATDRVEVECKAASPASGASGQREEIGTSQPR